MDFIMILFLQDFKIPWLNVTWHFNPVNVTGLFKYPLTTSENQKFLMFPGGIERD